MNLIQEVIEKEVYEPFAETIKYLVVHGWMRLAGLLGRAYLLIIAAASAVDLVRIWSRKMKCNSPLAT